MSRQFVLAVAALFCVYSMNELIRLATPIALKAIRHGGVTAAQSGLTFTLGGLVSAISVLALAPLVFKPGRVRYALGAAVRSAPSALRCWRWPMPWRRTSSVS